MRNAFYGEIYKFPTTPEMRDIDSLVEASHTAYEELAPDIDDIDIAKPRYTEVLSNSSNKVCVLDLSVLPGGFKYLSGMTAVKKAVETGQDDLVSFTAGSFGLAIGRASQRYGARITAFMPEGSDAQTVQVIRDSGVVVIERGTNVDETGREALRFAHRHDKGFIHPYAGMANLAGTGILGLIAKDWEFSHLVVPVGGGSLLSGFGTVLKQVRAEPVHIQAAQVVQCSPYVNSLISGELQAAKDREWPKSPSTYFRTLGGLGVGSTDPLTLAAGSRITDSAAVVETLDAHATMADFSQETGQPVSFEAGVSMEAARRMARTPGISGATILALNTGGKTDRFDSTYLNARSQRRALQERYRYGDLPLLTET